MSTEIYLYLYSQIFLTRIYLYLYSGLKVVFVTNCMSPQWKMDLPNLQPEPGIKEMVKACDRVTKDKEKKAWPKLKVGEAVRGQDPKSDIWEIGGTVTDVVHRGRSVFVEFYKGGSRLFKRANVKVDTTKKVEEEKKQEEEVKGSKLNTIIFII